MDVDSRELVSGWVAVTSVSAPQVLRHYDVAVPLRQPLNKKIVFKNPWNLPRRFAVHSSDENVMQSRTPHLDVNANGSAYVRLVFNPHGSIHSSGNSGNISAGSELLVYLFLNDESGQNEECFSFRVIFSR